jgi:putative endonuclease
MRGIGKRFVHILRSGENPEHHYVGTTSDAESRLDWHNHGPCGHTTRYRPWSMVVVIELPTKRQAVRFDKYLKSGSGRAFARCHVGPDQRPGGWIRVRRADGIPCGHAPRVSEPPVAGALRRLWPAPAASENGRCVNPA